VFCLAARQPCQHGGAGRRRGGAGRRQGRGAESPPRARQALKPLAPPRSVEDELDQLRAKLASLEKQVLVCPSP